MTDLLTKEERETVERAKALLANKWDYGVGEWVGVAEILMDIIDNLSKRGVKKYSEEELRKFVKDSGISYHYFYAYFEGVTDFARFLGVLEEK